MNNNELRTYIDNLVDQLEEYEAQYATIAVEDRWMLDAGIQATMNKIEAAQAKLAA